MKKYVPRSRKLRSKLFRKKRVGGRGGKRFPARRNRHGILKLFRKAPEMSISNTGVLGGVAVTHGFSAGITPTLTIGTPVQSMGATGTNSYDVPFTLKFALNQIINYTDVTALCDKYRLLGCYVRVYNNQSSASVSTNTSIPLIQYIEDYDDSAMPTVQSLREKTGVRFKTFKNASSYISMKIHPRPNITLQETTLLTGIGVPNKSPWITTADSAVLHYGIKGVISNFCLPGAAANQNLLKFDVAIGILGKDFE